MREKATVTDPLRGRLDAGVLAEMAAGEPRWLGEARARALELQHQLPPPDRTLHRWRYVDPARLAPGGRTVDRRAPLTAPAPLAADSGASIVVRRGPAGGTVAMTGAARAAGVEVLDLAQAAREREDLVRPWLGALVQSVDNPFAALNGALWSGGLFLFVPPRTRLDAPIHLVTEVGGDGLVLPRSLLIIGEGAEVSVLEEIVGADGVADAPLVHQASEVIVGAGAMLNLVAVQELPLKATSTSMTFVRLDAGAQLLDLFAAFGGSLAKADLAVDLRGRGASAQVLGAVFGGGRQQFDHHTIIDHEAPDTSSNLDVRVAVQGRAKSSATGRLYIAHDAVRSEAYQENRNLLLSESASAVLIPELEILTDEVQAKHGATVGPIDEDQLYYLNSRGLSPVEATAMIVEGFFESILARVPAGLTRERVRTRVQARLSAPAGR